MSQEQPRMPPEQAGGGGGVLANQGMTIAETSFPGVRIITQSIAGQMIGGYLKPLPGEGVGDRGGVNDGVDVIAMREALDALTLAVCADNPVDQSDKLGATGSSVITPGDDAAADQSVANANARLIRDEEDKYNFADITDAMAKLPVDKLVTEGDAEEEVMSAELKK